MQTIFRYFFIILVFGSVQSCVTSPDFPVEPNIEFISFTKNQLRQGSINNDSTFLVISFEDGDGDIGLENSALETNLVIVDNRTQEIYNQYKTPFIPEEGVGNGIQGEMRILMFTTCCIFPDNIPPCESPDLYPTNDITFDVYLTDRAGNRSNTITTPALTLICN